MKVFIVLVPVDLGDQISKVFSSFARAKNHKRMLEREYQREYGCKPTGIFQKDYYHIEEWEVE